MAKDHMEDPEGWLFKRSRHPTDHIDNCTDGYCEPKGRDPNVLEIHHALCVHACSDKTLPGGISEDQKTFIHSCLAITDWKINDGANNIGLPKKWAYVEDTPNKTGWDGYPCHQVDHDLYLKAVEVYVADNIWKKVKKAKKGKECEELKGDKLAEKFNTGSKKWKKFLTDRGKKHGGTKACLDYCLDGDVQTTLESTWHIPFSMAPTEAEVRGRVKPKATTKLQRLGLLTQAIT